MGVCHRVLGNAADAEEAYQATFMVMARRTGSLSWNEIVAGWLHETAYKTALSQCRKRSNAKKRSNHVVSFKEDPQAKEFEPDRAAMLRELNSVLVKSFAANLNFRARLSANDRTKIESIQFEASHEEPAEMELSIENEDSPNSVEEPSSSESEMKATGQ